MKISLLSFFSGSGFLDLGFEDAGYSVDFVNEIHVPFLDAYKYSRQKLNKHEPTFGYSKDDIKDFFDSEKQVLISVMESARQNADVVGFIGGPPCPDFSVGPLQNILSEFIIPYQMYLQQVPYIFLTARGGLLTCV